MEILLTLNALTIIVSTALFKSRRIESPTPMVFDQISLYWAEIAEANATEEQLKFVRKHVSTSGLVLDLNCGSGRHAMQLHKEGYHIIGLDLSSHLISIAKTKAAELGISLALVKADMRNLPFRSEAFENVISLDSSYGYLPTDIEDIKSLNEVHRIMTQTGSFLFDVFNGEYMSKRYAKKFRIRELFFGLAKFSVFFGLFRQRDYPDFCLVKKRNVTDEGKKLIDVWVFREKKTGKISVAKHVIRLYSFSRLKELLSQSGLKVVSVLGGYEDQEFSNESRRLIVIAQKTS
jgi:SAM-dependent methyltransferase